MGWIWLDKIPYECYLCADRVGSSGWYEQVQISKKNIQIHVPEFMEDSCGSMGTFFSLFANFPCHSSSHADPI